MPFYKFLLNAGHCGPGKSNELKIYLYANSYTQALKQASNFPSVKHKRNRAMLNSTLIEESEYIQGIVQNAYNKELNNGNIITKLANIVRIFSYIKNYNFITEEGKRLKSFCEQYSSADNDQKKLIEQEYNEWVKTQLLNNNDEILNLNII